MAKIITSPYRWSIVDPDPVATALILDVYAYYDLHAVVDKGYIIRSNATRRGVTLLERVGLMYQSKSTSTMATYRLIPDSKIFAIRVLDASPSPQQHYEAMWTHYMEFENGRIWIHKNKEGVNEVCMDGRSTKTLFYHYANYRYAEVERNYANALAFIRGGE